MDPVIKIGQVAPLFELPDLNGKNHSLQNYQGRIVVLNFWSAECPWARRVDQTILPLLASWRQNVIYLPIAANAQEPLDLIRLTASQRGLPVVLHDPNQQVADTYGAQTTPHFFVIGTNGILRYQGAFDDVTFRQRQPSMAYLPAAVEALRRGEQPDPAQTDPYGCAIVRHTYP